MGTRPGLLGLACAAVWLWACGGGKTPQPSAAGAAPLPVATHSRVYVLIQSQQIAYIDLDANSGELTLRGTLQQDSSFVTLRVDPAQRRIFGLSPEGLLAFTLDPAAATLQPLGRALVAGSDVSDLWVHPGQRWAIASHNPRPGDGVQRPELELFALDAAGIPAPPTRLEGTSAATSLIADPSGRWLFGASCEAAAIAQYGFDAASGRLTQNAPAPEGTAGNDLVFHPNGKWAYLARDLDVRQLLLDSATGRMQAGEPTLYELPSSPNAGAMNCWRARIAVHPTGRFVYALVNLGGGAVYTFAVAPDTGRLTRVGVLSYERFRGPTSLAVDRSGRYLFAGGGSNLFHLFALDDETGEPEFVKDVPGTQLGGTITALIAP